MADGSASMGVDDGARVGLLLASRPGRLVPLDVIESQCLLFPESDIDVFEAVCERDIELVDLARVDCFFPDGVGVIAGLQRPLHRFLILLESFLMARNVKIGLVLLYDLSPRIHDQLGLQVGLRFVGLVFEDGGGRVHGNLRIHFRDVGYLDRLLWCHSTVILIH